VWTRAAVAALVAVAIGAPPVAASAGVRPDPGPGCPTCHGDPLIAARYDQRLYVPESELASSAHAALGCTCHPPLSPALHEEPGADLESTLVSCVGCHDDEAEAYVSGSHVRRIVAARRMQAALAGAALGRTCTVCHGAHSVEPTSSAVSSSALTTSIRPTPLVALAFTLAGVVVLLLGGLLLARPRFRRGWGRPRRTVRSTAEVELTTRRRFLGLVGAATAGAAIGTISTPRAAGADRLAREHSDDPAVLIDVTRCIGCGSCAAACKLSNDLEFRDDQPWAGADAQLAYSNWCVVSELPEDVYVKRQCMHCLEPACVSVCPVRAMQKQPLGPVTYEPDRCIGCRYCLMACPFGVPTFAWDKPIAEVSKCDLCFDRVSRGEKTACSSVCPQGAIAFGRRVDMLEEAWSRIRTHPGHYRNHVYGEHEAGGTSVLYISDVSFSALGLPPGLPDDPLPEYTREISRLVPPFAAGVAAVLMALYSRRRKAIEAHLAAELGTGGPRFIEREGIGL